MSEETQQDEMQEILKEFITEAEELLEMIDQKFVEFEKSPEKIEIIDEIFRSVHTIKGTSGFLGLNQMVELTHESENVLNKLRQKKIKVTPDIMDTLLKSFDFIKILLKVIKSNEKKKIDLTGILEELSQIIKGSDKKERHGEKNCKGLEKKSIKKRKGSEKETKRKGIIVKKNIKTADQIKNASAEVQSDNTNEKIQKKVKEATEEKIDNTLIKEEKITKNLEADKTVHIDIGRLDDLMNLVGELVLDRNRLLNISSKFEEIYEDDPRFRELGVLASHVNRITTDLQLAVMKTRMQPIKRVFNRFPRMVRDLARDMSKEINLDIFGEETELDKSVIEEIVDPLVHLIRNAVDHGIEIPEERIKAGKTRVGNIRLSAYHEGNNIVFEIEDDGRGMDTKKIREKAIEKGIIDRVEADRLSEEECLNLIFTPGFSTAKKISDISGRGVGMDVVKTNITKLNGIIDIVNNFGKGNRIVIKLPLTIAIIHSLMVKVREEMFAIPLSSVVEIIKISSKEIHIIDGHEVVNVRGSVLSLIRLSDEFDIPLTENKDQNLYSYVVVVGIAEKRYGIVVERLCGQEEIVIKSIGEFLSDSHGVAGATITGDGKVVLILDIARLVQNLKAPK
ncbi:MAG TPA: chemotaxis protein CheA [Nitrospinota bacterium]|nr:chemotaxis protein CheA [Nitrospinota bacterium]